MGLMDTRRAQPRPALLPLTSGNHEPRGGYPCSGQSLADGRTPTPSTSFSQHATLPTWLLHLAHHTTVPPQPTTLKIAAARTCPPNHDIRDTNKPNRLLNKRIFLHAERDAAAPQRNAKPRACIAPYATRTHQTTCSTRVLFGNDASFPPGPRIAPDRSTR